MSSADRSRSDWKLTAGQLVQFLREDRVGIIRLNNLPSNILTQPLRQALSDALKKAIKDDGVEAIILTGSGASFCSGFDQEDLLARDPEPSLTSLCEQIEMSPKPVIASLHGTVVEAGLALALSAHYRIAGRAVRLGTPEVTLGLVPSGGLTQRLPRLVGAKAALDMLLSGKTITGMYAHEIGLVDEIATHRGQEEIVFARNLLAENRGPRRTRDSQVGTADGVAFARTIATRRAEVRNGRIEAPEQIVACVEAALLMPFDVGVAREAVARDDCFATPESRALRHAALSERRAAELPEVGHVSRLSVRTLGIIGTNAAALGVAMAALDSELRVLLIGTSAATLEQAENLLRGIYARALKEGRLPERIVEARLASLECSLKIASLSEAQLVYDLTGIAVDQRARLLARVEAILPEEIVLATGADRGFARLRKDLVYPERFIGIHTFAPAQTTRVAELVRLEGVSDRTLVTAHGFVQRIGKIPVTVGAQDGLIANTLQDAGRAAVDVLMLMGVRPARIDQVMRDYGFPMGPCEVMDTVGLVRMRGAVPQYLSSLGHGGRAAGQGFYTYSEDGRGSDDVAETALAKLREQAGLRPVALSHQEIVERIILAEANAGAGLLEAGAVSRPEDIDVVMMLAKGYPRYRGGPMKAADIIGILGAEKRLKGFESAAPDIWAPATLWHTLSKNGANFEKMNQI
ncbi:enoyl-CoA hydratase-related protein [Celeribacter litoreus]|uniref:enoyl-CoA hydratase-related protein n=1 Tax=Celeribacter litoreus TaxID=2876714 RepID=UPI001CCB172D|nr:enoyl-CoA hydratase-related protein [Celeribacter litoreus]MCA0043552.1 enoyl-CoA hydratase/isomerase family protein [Celeribacter litoreus]